MEQPDARRHAAGLDGIRALAVAVVVAYHLGVPGLSGGLLGVSVFFTLSGYLITSILLAELGRTGSISYRAFIGRRARRLLPGAWAMLAVVLVTALVTHAPKAAAWARQAFFAFVYVANWATIAHGDDYFSRFAGPGPLDHLWSLAIEEQFYLVWPTCALLLWKLEKRVLPYVVIATLTVLSTLAMARLHDPNAFNNTRAYEGTDARAAALLVGALFAWALPFDRVASIAPRRARVLGAFGVVAFAGMVACVALIDDRSTFFYRGGELLLSVATATCVTSAAHPATFIGRALSLAPLRWLGERSYGIYLWHMPVIALVPGAALTAHPLARGGVQVVLTLALSALSYAWLEDPIRRRRPIDARRAVAMVAVAPLAILSLVFWPKVPVTPPLALEPQLPVDTSPVPAPEPSTQPEVVAAAPEVLETRCRTLIHVGDSTSLALVSRDWIPKPEDQLAARYRSVGVEDFVPEISGARSIVEKYEDKPSAWEVVNKKRGSGYHGCWVFALGTNDPANIKGNLPGLAKRIEWMMVQAEGRPVLWTTTRTLLGSGPYDDAYMRNWNRALTEACARYPNMRVYDWAAEVHDGWYLADKIHPNMTGARERARRLAAALARAFPKNGESPAGCLVRSPP